MSAPALFLITFIASSVEMVEAATIVLAMEMTRGARSALAGLLAGIALLALLILLFAPLLMNLPIATVRVLVGAVALVFGLEWLRKAILRHAGLKSKHDEEQIFANVSAGVGSLKVVPSGIDRLGFVVSFKGVVLEGLEVVVIVLSTGSAQHRIPLAALGAGVAFVLVTIGALVVRKPLARVPENTMKLIVGVMLVSFGTYWTTEGFGVKWPNSDADIVALVVWYGFIALAASAALKQQRIEVSE